MRNKNIKKIIENHFYLNPSLKMRVREIERKLKIPLPSTIRYCKELKNEEILEKEKIGNVDFYISNKGNEKYLLKKKFYNLEQLYSVGLVEYIKRKLSNPGIIVFGSYSKGEDIESSDIDLYLETPSLKKINLEKFENILKRKIQLFRYRNLKKIKNENLTNNIINGFVLNGFIEVFS